MMDDIAIKNAADVFNLVFRIMKPTRNIPSDAIIYHYTSPIGFKEIVQSRRIWATDINYLNDSSELRYFYQLLGSLVKEHHESLDPAYCDFIQNQCYQIEKKYDLSNRLLFASKTDFYVTSFSLDQDNLNMWKCYTKTPNSIGYNIGFGKADLINMIDSKAVDSESIEGFSAYGKVIYSEKQQREMLYEAIISLNSIYVSQSSDFERYQIESISMDAFHNMGIFFKHSTFSDENEFRFVIINHVSNEGQENRRVKFREKDGIFIPYVEVKFPADAVKMIGISPTQRQDRAEYSVARMIESMYNLRYKDIFCSKLPYNP